MRISHPSVNYSPASLNFVASRVEERLATLVADTVERCRQEVDGWSLIDSPQAWDLIRSITFRSRRRQIDAARRDYELPIDCPAPDYEAAQLALRAGISLASALKSFRIGHSAAWSVWLMALADPRLETGERLELTSDVSRFLNAYDDRVADLFTEAYLEGERSYDPHQGVDLAEIRSILSGERECSSDLGYPIEAEHRALIVCGDDAASALGRIAAEVPGSWIRVRVADTLHWGWVAASRLDERWLVKRLGSALRGRQARVALGSPAAGVTGFRRSHRQAADAHSVAVRSSEQVTNYRDVALLGLLLRDERDASEFVDEHLGPLARSTRRMDELRLTLQSYFSSGQNAASTAAALRLHQQTVTRRIRTAEELIGSPINDERLHLETALRLYKLL